VGGAWRYSRAATFLTMYKLQKLLIEQWCRATVNDAVKLFHKARVHPDNEVETLEQIAIRCANSAFAHVAATIIGDRNATAERYGELCYARFKREIAKVVTDPQRKKYVC
jgi:hypothetical protein